MFTYGKSSDLNMEEVEAKYGNTQAPTYIEDIVEDTLFNLSDLIEKLGLKTPRIVYGKKGTWLAEYILGTYDWPVIIINIKELKKQDMIEESVINSLVHELVHAALEKYGVKGIFYKHDEDFVQELADHYSWHYNPDAIKNQVEEKANEIKKMEDFYICMADSDEDIYASLSKKWIM